MTERHSSESQQNPAYRDTAFLFLKENLAIMKQTDIQIDDFEHRVINRMKLYDNRPDFPRVEDYGFDRRALDDYLFDKQAILDSEGSLTQQYIILGFCMALPVFILDAIPEEIRPWGKWSIVAAIIIGLLLAFFIKSLRKMIVKIRLRKNANAKIDSFVNAVMHYRPKYENQ